MTQKDSVIPLEPEEIWVLGRWAADCATRALPVFEAHAPSDSRPRAAVEGIMEFARRGRRTAKLRSCAWAAYAAAREVDPPAAKAAARAAGLAAAIAYLHPLATPHQTNHVLGPAAYAAWACELEQSGDAAVGDSEIRRAIEQAPPEVGAVLQRMPARDFGDSRLDTLMRALDAGLRTVRILDAAADTKIRHASSR